MKRISMDGSTVGWRCRSALWVAWSMTAMWFPSAEAAIPERSPPYAATKELRADATLRAVAFVNPQTGLAVGDRGTILRSDDGGRTWQMQASGVGCQLDDLLWIDERRVVVIGGSYDRITQLSRGVVLLSNDGGRSWQRGVDEELPRLRKIRLEAETKSLIVVGDYSYPALASEFESHDWGTNWQGTGRHAVPAPLMPTDHSQKLLRLVNAVGATGAIRDLYRASENELWAVGDHGAIWSSADGGRHWQTRRGENRQVAVLVVASSLASDVWPLIGYEALEMRNRVAVLLADTRLMPRELDLANQAAVMLGASGVDVLGAAAVQQASDWIKIHRPDVVVLDQQLSESTRQAMMSAAVGNGVARVISCRSGAPGETTLHRSALLPKRGILISDLWSDTLQLVCPENRPADSISLRRLYDSVGTPLRSDSVVAGLLGHNSQAKRLAAPLEPAARRHLQMVQARMAALTKIDTLLEQRGSEAELAEALESLLDQTARDDQFRLIWSTLQRVNDSELDSKRGTGWQTQAVLGIIADRFGHASVGKWAQLQLDATRHSLEWSYLRQFESVTSGRETIARAVPVSPFQSDPSEVRQTGAISPIVVPKQQTIELTPADQSVAEIDLAWEFHPAILLCREAARHRGDQSNLQQTGTGSANLQRFVTSGPIGSAWLRLLQAGSGQQIIARRAEVRPRLDGRLDESCWTTALTEAGRRVSVQVAYDDDFVYLALRTPATAMTAAATADPQNRSGRDHQLIDVDRIRLSIDTDLDLLTSMQLQVDADGRTHDSVDGHAGWQPDWYVKALRSGESFQVEMAVLRRDLTELPIHSSQTWFLRGEVLAAGQAASWRPLPRAEEWLRVVFE